MITNKVNSKSVLMLLRDPGKTKEKYEAGYWKFYEFFGAKYLPNFNYKVIFLTGKEFPLLSKILRKLLKKEWKVQGHLLGIETVYSAICLNQPDVVISIQGAGYLYILIRLLMGNLAKSRVFIVVYRPFNYSRKGIISNMKRYLVRKILKSVTVLCVAPEQQKIFHPILDIPQHGIKFFPFGVDSEFFSPNNKELLPQEKYSLQKYIFCPGDSDRDDELLFKACKDIPINIIRVTRDHIYADKIKELSVNLGISERVQVLTRVNSNNLFSLYRNSLFVVIPVRNNDHPAGLTSLLEVMACGKAVLVSEGLSSNYYSENMVTAMHYRHGDLNDLRNKILLLYDNSDLRNSIGKAARDKVEKMFNLNSVSSKLLSIVEMKNK